MKLNSPCYTFILNSRIIWSTKFFFLSNHFKWFEIKALVWNLLHAEIFKQTTRFHSKNKKYEEKKNDVNKYIQKSCQFWFIASSKMNPCLSKTIAIRISWIVKSYEWQIGKYTPIINGSHHSMKSISLCICLTVNSRNTISNGFIENCKRQWWNWKGKITNKVQFDIFIVRSSHHMFIFLLLFSFLLLSSLFSCYGNAGEDMTRSTSFPSRFFT